jgi:hypothetical protein
LDLPFSLFFGIGVEYTLRYESSPEQHFRPFSNPWNLCNLWFSSPWNGVVLFCLFFFVPLLGFSQRLTPLSHAPDWGQLNRFQETITHDEFVDLLDSVYAPNGAGAQWIRLEETRAIIQENASDQFVLRFAVSPLASKPVPRYWTAAESFSPNSELPLCGVQIAIDPGHLGGSWAKMEERWFQIGNSIPVVEGDMTLRVAQILAPRLESLGATVTLVRSSPGPVTTVRPEALKAQAEASLRERGITNLAPSYSGPDDPNREDSIPWEAERLFYRVDEIHTRAEIVNEKIKPDLVLCLHFDAEPWGTSSQVRHVVEAPEPDLSRGTGLLGSRSRVNGQDHGSPGLPLFEFKREEHGLLGLRLGPQPFGEPTL